MNGAPGVVVRRVKRFTEKPDRARAEEFVASGNYAWNGGIFLWSARTLAGAIREHCPAMAPLLEKIAAAWGTADFERVFAEVYPLCENISVDYAVLEPRSAKGEGRSEIYCVPGDFGWNDLGSWAALHEHLTDGGMETVVEGAGSVAIDAARNYVYAPGKMVAMVGVSDLVVVETEDALLVTTRERSQDVGKVVAELKGMGKGSLI
jgi:mannose-1-phosphate guanylyltransferase